MNKPYYSLNRYYQSMFGEKTVKITIDGGFSCPNRKDRNSGGCRFCSLKGSGDFTTGAENSISEQIYIGKKRLAKKWPRAKYIAYFQAYTNTYAPVDELLYKYTQAMSQPDVVGLAIATRPDCLPEDVVLLLKSISQQFPLWVELGLQTSNPKTAAAMNLGYTPNQFKEAVLKLNALGIETVAHVILGLPNETTEDMLNTIDFINSLPIKGVKLQLLHVLKNTPLAEDYSAGLFKTLSREDYISIIVQALAALRPDIVIHRLTGDGAREDLIAPLWSLEKSQLLNKIHEALNKRSISQGQSYKK